MHLTRLVLFVVVSFGALAHAGKLDEAKRAQARQRYEVGSKLYNIRDYDKALDEFKAVYLLTGEPSLLFNIGQCERQLNRPEDARKSFKAYLREGRPNAQQIEDVERMIVIIDAAIAEKERLAREQAAKDVAPAPVLTPEPASPSVVAAPVTVIEAPPAKPKSRKWVWGVVGASIVVVVGVGVGLGIGLTRGVRYPSPSEGSVDGN